MHRRNNHISIYFVCVFKRWHNNQWSHPNIKLQRETLRQANNTDVCERYVFIVFGIHILLASFRYRIEWGAHFIWSYVDIPFSNYTCCIEFLNIIFSDQIIGDLKNYPYLKRIEFKMFRQFPIRLKRKFTVELIESVDSYSYLPGAKVEQKKKWEMNQQKHDKRETEMEAESKRVLASTPSFS